MNKITHDFYKDGDDGWIPDVQLLAIQGDRTERKVWFLWRGTPQWVEMTTAYDGYWLITETEYTHEFQDWLDEELDGYDSLESMFSTGVEDVIPERYSVEFEVGE